MIIDLKEVIEVVNLSADNERDRCELLVLRERDFWNANLKTTFTGCEISLRINALANAIKLGIPT